MDQTYMPFVELYRRSGKPLADPEDFIRGWSTWKVLDFEQQAQRCERLAAGLDAGEWSEPKYIPSPQSFLLEKWKIPLPRKPVTKADETRTELRKLLAEEAQRAIH
jgi:hypothetical protein